MYTFELCESRLAVRASRLPALPEQTGRRLLAGLPTLCIALAVLMAAATAALWAHLGWADRLAFASDVVLYAAAVRALRERRLLGWRLLFYGTLIQPVYAALSVALHEGSTGGLVGRVVAAGLVGAALLQLRPLLGQAGEAGASRPEHR